jgi:hypothetical protein
MHGMQDGQIMTGDLIALHSSLSGILGYNQGLQFGNIHYGQDGAVNSFGIDLLNGMNGNKIFGYTNTFDGADFNIGNGLITGQGQNGIGINAGAFAQAMQAINSIFGPNASVPNVSFQSANTFNINIGNQPFQFTMNGDQFNPTTSTLTELNAAMNATGVSTTLQSLISAAQTIQNLVGQNSYLGGMDAVTGQIMNIINGATGINTEYGVQVTPNGILNFVGLANGTSIPMSALSTLTGLFAANASLVSINNNNSMNINLGNQSFVFTPSFNADGSVNFGQSNISNANNTISLYAVQQATQGMSTLLNTAVSANSLSMLGNNAFGLGLTIQTGVGTIGGLQGVSAADAISAMLHYSGNAEGMNFNINNALIAGNAYSSIVSVVNGLKTALNADAATMIGVTAGVQGSLTFNASYNNMIGSISLLNNGTYAINAALAQALAVSNANTFAMLNTLFGENAMKSASFIVNDMAALSNLLGGLSGMLLNGSHFGITMEGNVMTIDGISVGDVNQDLQQQINASAILNKNDLSLVLNLDGNAADGNNMQLVSNERTYGLNDKARIADEKSLNDMVSNGIQVRFSGSFNGQPLRTYFEKLGEEGKKSIETTTALIRSRKMEIGDVSDVNIVYILGEGVDAATDGQANAISISAESVLKERSDALMGEVSAELGMRSNTVMDDLIGKEVLANAIDEFLGTKEGKGVLREGMSLADAIKAIEGDVVLDQSRIYNSEDGTVSDEALVYMLRRLMANVILTMMKEALKQQGEGEKGDAEGAQLMLQTAVDKALGLWKNVIDTFELGTDETGKNALAGFVTEFVREMVDLMGDADGMFEWEDLVNVFKQLMSVLRNFHTLDAFRELGSNVAVAYAEALKVFMSYYKAGVAAEAKMKSIDELYVVQDTEGTGIQKWWLEAITKVLKEIEAFLKGQDKKINVKSASEFTPESVQNDQATFYIGRLGTSEEIDQDKKKTCDIVRYVDTDEKSVLAGLTLLQFQMVRYEMLAAYQKIKDIKAERERLQNELKILRVNLKKEIDTTRIQKLKADITRIQLEIKDSEAKIEGERVKNIDESMFKGLQFCTNEHSEKILNAIERISLANLSQVSA